MSDMVTETIKSIPAIISSKAKKNSMRDTVYREDILSLPYVNVENKIKDLFHAAGYKNFTSRLDRYANDSKGLLQTKAVAFAINLEKGVKLELDYIIPNSDAYSGHLRLMVSTRQIDKWKSRYAPLKATGGGGRVLYKELADSINKEFGSEQARLAPYYAAGKNRGKTIDSIAFSMNLKEALDPNFLPRIITLLIKSAASLKGDNVLSEKYDGTVENIMIKNMFLGVTERLSHLKKQDWSIQLKKFCGCEPPRIIISKKIQEQPGAKYLLKGLKINSEQSLKVEVEFELAIGVVQETPYLHYGAKVKNWYCKKAYTSSIPLPSIQDPRFSVSALQDSICKAMDGAEELYKDVSNAIESIAGGVDHLRYILSQERTLATSRAVGSVGSSFSVSCG